MKNISIEQFKVTAPIQLKDVSTTFDLGAKKKEIEKELEAVREKLGDFQNTIYAHGKYAVLICIQGRSSARRPPRRSRATR